MAPTTSTVPGVIVAPCAAGASARPPIISMVIGKPLISVMASPLRQPTPAQSTNPPFLRNSGSRMSPAVMNRSITRSSVESPFSTAWREMAKLAP